MCSLTSKKIENNLRISGTCTWGRLSLVFMPQDTIDHQKNYSKISKIKREEKDLTPLSIEENLRRNQKTHIPFFCLKKITKKRKFTSQFFEKKIPPNFSLSFFPIKCCKKI